MVQTLQNFINGEFVTPAGTGLLDIVNPVTGDVVAQIARLRRRPTSTPPWPPPRTPSRRWKHATPGQRQLMLLKLADAIEANSDELVEAQHRNTGQVRSLIASEEVAAGADQLRFFAGAARILEGKSAGEYFEGHTSYVRREPIGVVAQVAPWNYPFLMAIWKIGPALAAGNTVVLKPSDTTPESTLVLARLAEDILPAGVLNVVLGTGETGAMMVEHKVPGLVSITGSVRAGIAVASGAAKGLKRAHLELGGKAPAIVFKDADIKKSAAAIAEFAFFNAGQDCTAITRVLVEDSVHDDVVAAMVEHTKTLHTGSQNDEDNYFGPLNNVNHFNAVSSVVEHLPANCRIETGGHRAGEQGLLLRAHHHHRRQADRRHRAEGNLRPGHHRAEVQHRGGGRGAGQRRRIRPGVQRLDQRPRHGHARSAATWTSVRSGSTRTSCSPPKCRTAASSSPATARTSPCTASRTTRASSTS